MARRTGAVVPASVMRAVVRRFVRPVLGPDVSVRRQRRLLDAFGRIARLPRGTRVDRVVLGGRPAERITMPGSDRRRVVLYLHGGGYTVGSPTTHRALAAHLAAAAGAPVYLLDYRLAPEHPYPAAVDDAEAAYRTLLGMGIDPRHIGIAGDSAGGGLSLALMIRLRAAGAPLPGAVALISPWTDLTLDGVRDDPSDPMLRPAWLRACAARYAPAADLRAPELSPSFADLAGLPPILAHAASNEILLDSVERFVERARAAGVSVDFRRLEGLWHVVHLHAGLVAAATSAVCEIGEFLRETTTPPAPMEAPMSADNLTVLSRAGLPASLTPALVERLTARITVRPDAEHVTTHAPYTGRPIADLPLSTPDDVTWAFEIARRAQRDWRATPVRDRARIMLRFHDLVLARQDEVLDLMQAENGKTRRDAFLEVADMALTSRYYARSARALLKPSRRRGAFPLLTHATELRHPKGVVGVVSPWNYPLSLAAGDTIPALLAGNAVVQKPDTQTALTALWAATLMDEAGLPPGLWQIVLGSGRTIGAPLMANADYMMFTGSTATGRKIAADAGHRLIGASLELGGKNALIVLDDASPNRAAEGAVRAAFSSSGQLCISVERIYVHRAVYGEFVARFVARVEALRLDPAYDYSSEMGSLTNASQLDTVVDHVGDAVAKGATLLAGGKARPDLGPFFHEPTVLTAVTPDMTLYQEETFGPVVSVYPFDDEEQAVALANDTVYGLNASVWTRDGARGRALASRLRAGTVNVNEAFAAAWGSLDAPMGGMGDSGLGRRHGTEGLLKYTEAQTVAHQRLLGFAPPGRMPYGLWAKTLTAALKSMKRTGMK